jgi:hypothetical protein
VVEPIDVKTVSNAIMSVENSKRKFGSVLNMGSFRQLSKMRMLPRRVAKYMARTASDRWRGRPPVPCIRHGRGRPRQQWLMRCLQESWNGLKKKNRMFLK